MKDKRFHELLLRTQGRCQAIEETSRRRATIASNRCSRIILNDYYFVQIYHPK